MMDILLNMHTYSLAMNDNIGNTTITDLDRYA